MNIEEQNLIQEISLNRKYETYIINAINSEHATPRVLEYAMTVNNKQAVLLAIVKSPLINPELFEEVFKNSKFIDYKNDLMKEMIKSPFFTIDMFNYCVDNISYNGDYIEELITSKFCSEDTYLRLLSPNNVISSNLCRALLKGQFMSSKVLQKIIELKKRDDVLLQECLDSIFMTSEILELAIDFCFDDYDKFKQSIIKILNHRLLTTDMLIVGLNKSVILVSLIREELLESPLCNAEILKLIAKETGYFNSIINHEKVDHEVLLELVSTSRTYQNLEEIINHSQANEEVFIKVIKIACIKAKQTYYSGEYNSLIEKIISKENVTESVFLEILEHYSTTNILNIISNHPNITVSVKVHILKNKGSINEEELNNLFALNGLESKHLVDLIESNPSNLELLKRSMNSHLVNRDIYLAIVDAIYSAKKFSDEIFDELLSKDIEEAILVHIVNKSYLVTQIEKVINHPNSNLNVIAAVNIKSDDFGQIEQQKLLELAKELKHNIIAKIYKIEAEQDVSAILRMNVEDGMSTMLWGPSGVGKSSRVYEIDPTATSLILKNGMLPEVVIGGKEPNGQPGELYPPVWYNTVCEKCQKEPDRMHILFIDEFTNVNDTIKNLVWEIVGNRSVNGNENWKLPDNCAIVVAGNRPEESSAVRIDVIGGVMPAPLHNRIDSMIEIKFDIDEWQRWALETDAKTGKLRIHPIVYSFCVANSKGDSNIMFTQFDPNKVTEPFVTPRKWETLSKAIYAAESRGKNVHISYARIKSILGDNNITNAFIEHYERLPLDMRKIENGEYVEDDFKTIEDKLYALGIVIAQYQGDEVAIEDFIVTCLGDEYLSIYMAMKNMRNSVLNNLNKNTDGQLDYRKVI